MSQPKMPSAEPSGFTPTLNKMGYMTAAPDYFSKEWIDFSGRAKLPSLEIGAAYGVATIPALESGATIIANDIDPRHLDILKQRVPAPLQKNLILRPGRFPGDIEFDPHSLEAILICRVLHFFDQPTIELAFQKMSSWLAPKGRLFALTETPYLKNFQEFIPIYESRVAAGEKFPGYVEDVMKVAPERGKTLPPAIHFMNVDVLSRLAKNAGLIIKECHTISATLLIGYQSIDKLILRNIPWQSLEGPAGARCSSVKWEMPLNFASMVNF
jgi:hypothetical protein